MATLENSKDTDNPVNQLGRKIATYNFEDINTIVNTSNAVHVSFPPALEDHFWVIQSMIGIMGSFARPSAGLENHLDCYLYGFIPPRILHLKKSHKTPGNLGLPVYITASKVDGLVLPLPPSLHGYNCRFAVLFGHAMLVTAEDERIWAMELIKNQAVPENQNEMSLLRNKLEISLTYILRVQIESANTSIKGRPPVEERSDRADEEFMGKKGRECTPLNETYLKSGLGTCSQFSDMPNYIKEYHEAVNDVNLEYAKLLVDNLKHKKV